MDESSVIEQLSSYRQKLARIEVLSTYSVGGGITVSRLNEDDQLQELHRKLRGLPSYMYLNKRELQLEQTAHAYLGGRYPAGVKSQKAAIPAQGVDEEDTKLLQALRGRIERVVKSRGWDVRDDIDDVIERLSELQDLQAEVERVDAVMNALKGYKPDYARLLRLRYIEDLPLSEVCKALSVVKKTYFRWRIKSIYEYGKLSGN